MPDETLQSLRQKLNETLQNAVEQSPEYQGFLQAIADAEDAITQMNKTDNYGRIPIVDGAKRLELMRLYREIGMKAENVFRSDADKTRRELVKKITNDVPILLLDDVLSELDSGRQNYLLNSIGDIQTIITCTGLDEFVNNRFQINKVYKVTNGSVEEMTNIESA